MREKYIQQLISQYKIKPAPAIVRTSHFLGSFAYPHTTPPIIAIPRKKKYWPVALHELAHIYLAQKHKWLPIAYQLSAFAALGAHGYVLYNILKKRLMLKRLLPIFLLGVLPRFVLELWATIQAAKFAKDIKQIPKKVLKQVMPATLTYLL